MALFSAGFVALGIWQLQRRHWKLDLIARVDNRVHATPIDAPPPAAWPAINAANDEYLHVRTAGHFLNDRSTLVKAVTEYGSGYWLLTPLQTNSGFVVLINRGFVPVEWHAPPASLPTPDITITGLLRISEPKGGFLHDNSPQDNRWYSRDVAAIAAARQLDSARTAPYFIDADAHHSGTAAGTQPAYPVAGLTTVKFRNQHLNYALTWFTLALMPAAFLLITIRHDLRLRKSNPLPE